MADDNVVQAQLVSLLLEYPDLAEDFVNSSIKPHYFEEQYRLLLQAILLAQSEGRKLTRKSYLDFVAKTTPVKKKISQEEVLFNKINFLSPDPNDYQMLKGQVYESYLLYKSTSVIEEFNKLHKDKGVNLAVKQLAQKMQELSETADTTKKIIYEDVNAFGEEYIQWLADVRDDKIEPQGFVSTGFEELDKTSAVGAAPGTLTLFVGDVGGFKSTMMLNVAMNAWLKGKKNVLFIPLEMPRRFIEHKMVSRESKIPFEYVSNPKSLNEKQINNIKEIRLNNWANQESKFYIMDSMEGRTRVSTIKQQIKQHIEIFKPDVVVVDYIANLESDQKKDRADIEIGDMLKELFHMGKEGVMHEKGFGVVSGAQIGRSALKRVRAQPGDRMQFHSEDVRGAHDYSADATTIFALFPDPQQPSEKLWVFVVKSRYGMKTFPDGSTKAQLDVRPELSLITSPCNYEYTTDEQDDILMKADDDFEDDVSSKEDSDNFADSLGSLQNNDDDFLNFDEDD